MRVAMNITTADEDLSRFAGPDDLRGYLDEHHLDGIEVMPLGDSLCWLPPERVLGMHLSYYPCWVDFWRGDEAGLIAEFGSLDAAAAHYGGADRRVLVDKFASQLAMAERIGARYAVFHVADVSTAESVRYRFGHTDEQVVASALELIDAFAGDWRGRCRLLVENLWWPGLTMARPEVTRALMDGIRTPGKGIMLDTGHLMHTNPALTTGEEAAAYIHQMLDRHGALCDYIAGVHLHASLSGEKIRSLKRRPPALTGAYFDRLCQAYEHVLAVDGHGPFEAQGLPALIDRIAPEYLTFEFISRSRAEYAGFLTRQNAALGRGAYSALRSGAS